MSQYNFRAAIRTLVLSICLTALGYVIDKSFRHKEGLILTVPFLFGVSIVLANLRAAGTFKIAKMLLAGIVSVCLLWFAIWFVVVVGAGWELFVFSISGINSAALLRIYSSLLKTVQPAPVNYVSTVVLCIFASWLGHSGEGEFDLDLVVMLWSSFFTVGLTTALVPGSNVAREVGRPSNF